MSAPLFPLSFLVAFLVAQVAIGFAIGRYREHTSYLPALAVALSFGGILVGPRTVAEIACAFGLALAETYLFVVFVGFGARRRRPKLLSFLANAFRDAWSERASIYLREMSVNHYSVWREFCSVWMRGCG